jgi:hypothetical protein
MAKRYQRGNQNLYVEEGQTRYSEFCVVKITELFPSTDFSYSYVKNRVLNWILYFSNPNIDLKNNILKNIQQHGQKIPKG